MHLQDTTLYMLIQMFVGSSLVAFLRLAGFSHGSFSEQTWGTMCICVVLRVLMDLSR